MRTSLAMALAALVALAGPAVAQVELSGQWQLDTTRSADLERALVNHARNQGLRSRSSMSGGEATLPGGIPGQGGNSPRIRTGDSRVVDVAEVLAQARLMTYGGNLFEIQQIDSAIVFEPLNLAYDRVSVVPDGKKRRTNMGLEAEMDVRAEWKSDHLKIVRETNEMSVTEYWSLAKEPGFLVVEVRMKGRMFQKKLELWRVYRKRS